MTLFRLLLVAILTAVPATAAELALAPIFGDHMVLQRDVPVRIWGAAGPGERVAVSLAGERAATVADVGGAWTVELPAREAGGPYELLVSGAAETLRLEDVLFGEVWLCSGQSNMRFPLRRAASAESAVPAADHSRLRLYDLLPSAHPGAGAFGPELLARCNPSDYFRPAGWKPCTPGTASGFSAVAYFFGAELQASLGVPVGLVHNAVGGACIEAFISAEGLRKSARLAPLGDIGADWLEHELVPGWCRQRARENLAGWLAEPEGPMPGHPFQPGFLFDAGVRPLGGLGLAGVIWYQGESNATHADMATATDPELCRAGIQALVGDWRRHFGRPDLPFLHVQLPGLGRPWMEFREVQAECARDPHSGLAVTIDLGHPTDVHPRAKREVGRRLERQALARVYGRRVTADGPRLLGMRRRRDTPDRGGDALVLTFRTSGLWTRGDRPPRGFEVAGRDGVWHPADALLGGDSVRLTSRSVPAPVAARYAWAPLPDANLFDGSRLDGGLPAGPVRAGASARPNVLLVVSEDNGPDLSCYGDQNVRTPHLDALAREGVRFESAFVPCSVCSQSRASLLTGLYPHQHGQIGLATHRFAMYRAVPTLPTLLHEAGYRTGLLGKLHVNPEAAFHFDHRWSDPAATSFAHRDVARIAAEAEEFMGAGAGPFFLMVSLPDAHAPFLRQQHGLPEDPLDPGDVLVPGFVGVDSPRLRQGTADYYNCVRRMDSGVGLLLEALERTGRAADTLVVYLSDHGPQLSRGKTTCHDAGLRVPLIVRWPGTIRVGQVSEALVSSLDVMPTLCAAAGVDVPPGLPGRSLLEALPEAQERGHEHVFGERFADAAFFYFPQRTVRNARYRLIRTCLPGREDPEAAAYAEHFNPHFAWGTTAAELAAAEASVRRAYATWRRPPALQLYDLQRDPAELVDLADDPDHGAVRERLERILDAWQEETDDRIRDPEVLERLTREHEAAPEDYRRRPEFRWGYAEYLETRLTRPVEAESPR